MNLQTDFEDTVSEIDKESETENQKGEEACEEIKDYRKYKARLEARGCQQNSENMDFKDIFSYVVQTGNLRLLFSEWEPGKEILMKIPERYNAPEKICLLIKALYGLKQAPLQCNKRLTDFLKDKNIKQLNSDQCVFKRKNKDKQMFLAIHVDHGILFGEDKHEMNMLSEGLKKLCDIIIHKNPTLKCNKQVLKKYQMDLSKPISTLIIPIEKNIQESKNYPDSDFSYREIIGSMFYLSCKIRPDLTFAVNYKNRPLKKPLR
ncbi:Reverse transcriptase, RNA-dependent DNA polymerase [Cinara cedri]|uniref:Reverse transcriptase, RNA-dependent DNA polymerase n=1 Tax=Cinara cedri TaxID=506608 RepID=A0A5E4NJ20_9HEMI|nr:Reverse transcriptase, RNA-dependent DNA polymerase [Cinara cedri]